MKVDGEDWEMLKQRSVARGILRHLLLRGDDLPANIARRTQHHPRSISRTVADLEDDGMVNSKGNGVWELTSYGAKAAALTVKEYGFEGENED